MGELSNTIKICNKSKLDITDKTNIYKMSKCFINKIWTEQIKNNFYQNINGTNEWVVWKQT